MFNQTVKKFPNKVMFYFQDQTWTFQDVDKYSNKVANYFLSQDYKKGDTIALFMENRPGNKKEISYFVNSVSTYKLFIFGLHDLIKH